MRLPQHMAWIRRVLVIVVAIAAIAWAVHPVSGDDSEARSNSISDDEAIAIYRRLMDRLRHAGFLPLTPEADETLWVGTRDTSKITEIPTVTVGGALQVKLDARTGECLRVRNDRVWRKWNEQQSHSQTIDANWTREEALLKCEAVVRAVWNRFPKDPYLAPRYPIYRSEGDMRGKWRVEWNETLNGYRYQAQGYGVSLHERFGLIDCGWGNTSDPCPTDVKITRMDAIKRARSLLDKAYPHLTWDSEHEGIAGLRSAHLDSRPDMPNGSLMIVKPVLGWERYGAVADKYATSKRATRLAYIVEFEPKEGRVPPGGSGSVLRVIRVYVDAATGEIIGGLSHF